MANILRTLEPEQIRRIGHEHMVVVPAVTEQLVSVRDYKAQLEKMDEVIQNVKARLAKLELDRAQLAVFLTEFDASKIDRRDTDPDVPLEAPKPDPRVRRERAALPEPERADVAEEPESPATAQPAPRARG